MNKEQIKSIIIKHDKDEEFNNLEYPNHKEAFVEFLETQGFDLNSIEIKEETGEPYIDSDGYSGIDSEITIPSLSLKVSITAFQHKGWDFYFNSVK